MRGLVLGGHFQYSLYLDLVIALMITDLFTQIRDDDSHILTLMIPIMKTMVMMLVINYFGGVDGNVAGSDCWLWYSFSILWPARVMSPQNTFVYSKT